MEKRTEYKSKLIFFVNGKKIEDEDVDPAETLLTYLREKLLLPGTKMGCSEGGCGACTVMVSKLDGRTGKIKHYSVNACLAPIGSLHGLAVTTVEGIGSTKTRLHPVQERLAKSHGSQCGFCTPGFVMSMYTLLRNNPEPTMQDIEENLVGNLCRCTGYRPILEGFRTFTKESGGCGRTDCCQLKSRNKSEEESKGEKTEEDKDLKQTSVLYDRKAFIPYDPSQEVIFPSELQINPQIFSQSLVLKSSQLTFYRVISLQELISLKHSHPEAKIVIGNTEVGIEVKLKNQRYPVILNPVDIPELTNVEVKDTYVEIGAAASLSDIDSTLREIVEKLPRTKTKALVSIVEMLQWFAGRQIRNVACLGGNIMTGSPISDLNPILMAAEALLVFQSVDNEREIPFDHKFYTGYRQNISRPDEVLISVRIPFTTEDQFFKTYKQARRRDDDIAIVNSAMKVSLDLQTMKIKSILLVFGGMAPTTVMALQTMKKLQGCSWNEKLVEDATSFLMEELKLPPSAPGGMVDYRMVLAGSFLVKFFLFVFEEILTIPRNGFPNLTISGECSGKKCANHSAKSVQFFQQVPEGQEEIDPVGRPIAHIASSKQTTGEATYIDDIPRYENELYAVLVLSTKARAKILHIDSSEALKLDGVEGFFSAKDLPGIRNETGCIVQDEEVFASQQVHCVGQVLGIIVASTQNLAHKASKLVKVLYEDIPNPVFTIEEAIEANSVWDPLIIEDGNVEDGFRNSKHVLEGEVRIGGQEHFYLETNVHIAIPHEDDEIEVISSTQSASELQHMIAKALNLKSNRVCCKVKRIGGGFGGKQTRSNVIAIPVAFAAAKTQKPVRLVLDRDEDMQITGGRQPFLAKWKVGFEDDGKLTALSTRLYSNAGWSVDLCEAVMMKAVFNVNNVYKIENLRVRGQCCKTNLPSNTAFRGFGNPQAIFVMEYVMSNVADYLGMDPIKMREKNMYQKSTIYKTHFGQEISNSTVQDCWEQVLLSSDYEKRKNSVEIFNRNNIFKKRGIYAVPLKFGVAYEVPFLNQGGALVLVYSDGSVLLSHGGMEMGQGLHTKMIQIASRVLQVPMDNIYIAETATDKVPNTTATAASVSSDLYGMAVMNACQKIMNRLKPYKEKHPDGKFNEWVLGAYMDRVCLSATGFYKTPNVVEYNFKEGKPATPFNYFVFGASVSEVEIDCLTGDHTVLRTDIVMDIGKSLNPAIDVGQIEGAFMQGYGLLTLEQLLYSSTGELLTKGPGTYKIPGVQDIPREFNVTLLRGSFNERAVYSSKAVGEPPLLSAVSVFMAIRKAVQSASGDSISNFRFDAPATAERIRMACKDWITKNIKSTNNGSFKPWSIEV